MAPGRPGGRRAREYTMRDDDLADRTPALSIRDLRFGYSASGGDVVRLDGLEVGAGEQVAMIGRSGCGKSTLLNLIAGVLDPDSGTVEVAGIDVHALRGAARDRFRGRTIGMIFQSFNLLAGFSALENVEIALMFSSMARSEHTTRARALLDHLGIERAGAPVEELSVGQQQRVAVARALACRPALVLADEPTASLDPENSEIAIALIRSACAEEGAALVCVSHDPGVAGLFERRVELEVVGV